MIFFVWMRTTQQNPKSFKIEKGLRIAQMVLCPIIKANLKEVETLDKTERGVGGFGSTGVK